jgi:hypothetical protein
MCQQPNRETRCPKKLFRLTGLRILALTSAFTDYQGRTIKTNLDGIYLEWIQKGGYLDLSANPHVD